MMQPVQQPSPPSRWYQARVLILRWLIASLAIFVAQWLVPGIRFSGPGWQIGLVALVFGLINALLRPILTLLTCPLVLLTLGLFGLVINAVLLLLTAQLADSMGIQFTIDGFWSAVAGALVISLVSTVLSYLSDDTRPNVVVRVQRGDRNTRNDR